MNNINLNLNQGPHQINVNQENPGALEPLNLNINQLLLLMNGNQIQNIQEPANQIQNNAVAIEGAIQEEAVEQGVMPG
jgi:hypothetical protein